MMDKQRWDAMQWIRQNTPEDAMIYFFYGDLYQQSSILYNTHRISTLVHLEDYVQALSNNTIKRSYDSMRASDSGARFPYKKNFFSYRFHTDEIKWENPDFCTMDYFVFDKVTGYQQRAQIIQYNMAIREAVLKSGEEAYSNEFVSIVKNNNKGGDCIEA
jgi:hypothetical protein